MAIETQLGESPPAERPSLAASVGSLWSSARWAIRVAWATNATLTLGSVVLALTRGLMPAGLALTARGMVNAAVTAFRGNASDHSALIMWLVLGFALTVADALTRLGAGLCTQQLRDDLNFRISSDIMQHASTLDIAFFEDAEFQDVLQRAKQNPADHVSRFVSEALSVSHSAMQIVSLLAILIAIEPLLFLVAVLFGLPYLHFQWRLAKRQHAVEHARTAKRRWTAYFVAKLTSRGSVNEVKILGLAPLLIDKFRALMAEFRDQDRRLYLRGFVGSSLFAVFTTAAIYAMFVRVAFRVLHGALTVGDLAIFGGATTRLRNTLETLIQGIANALEQTLYIANVREFLAAEPRIRTTVGLVPSASRAEIEFEHVSFTYPGSPEPALADVSFHIHPGETVALVGENGAGKTTLVKLLARLYEPGSGRIRFDGIDLAELSPDYLYEQIACVFQGFGRYEATAADNIAYGDWRRLLSDRDRVRQIAQLAGVDEVIASLPNGYDTLLGRMFGECDLSGGQWQSIAIARAFARNGSLLILDEPTSDLDARAEYKLFVRVRELAKGRTTLIISHRFSTVSMANRILVMDQGRIVESGTHQELLAQAGVYAHLYELHQRQMDAAGGHGPGAAVVAGQSEIARTAAPARLR
ncbi:MAG TPA: ABC transporter ATP-binding protein [Candidatus Kryptonia bacterium]|nr:ABC transporter ATP-binding protein [Candidatus Kryptonia bacterium]